MSQEMSDYVAENKLKRPSGQHHSLRLQDQVRNPKLFPTPRASAAMSEDLNNVKERGVDKGRLEERVAQQMWPTPSANEDAAGSPNGKMQKMLGNHPKVRTPGGGTLNPTWVEWLMGYPIGWTDLKDSETP